MSRWLHFAIVDRMGAVVGLVKLLGERGAKGAVEVSAWFKAPGGEDSQDLVEICE